MTRTEQGVDSSRKLLQIAFGATAFLAGLDKFFHLLADWEMYLSPMVTGLLPFSAATFMKIVGVIEMAAGVLVLVKPKLGAPVVAAWLVLIALQLLSTKMFFDLAVRDLVMAAGALTLCRLTAWRDALPAAAGR